MSNAIAMLEASRADHERKLATLTERRAAEVAHIDDLNQALATAANLVADIEAAMQPHVNAIEDYDQVLARVRAPAPTFAADPNVVQKDELDKKVIPALDRLAQTQRHDEDALHRLADDGGPVNS